jgi:hypothetical protein
MERRATFYFHVLRALDAAQTAPLRREATAIHNLIRNEVERCRQ